MFFFLKFISFCFYLNMTRWPIPILSPLFYSLLLPPSLSFPYIQIQVPDQHQTHWNWHDWHGRPKSQQIHHHQWRERGRENRSKQNHFTVYVWSDAVTHDGCGFLFGSGWGDEWLKRMLSICSIFLNFFNLFVILQMSALTTFASTRENFGIFSYFGVFWKCQNCQ